MHSFTLDNGLAVHVLPYGEAPFVRATLKLKGSTTASEPKKGMERHDGIHRDEWLWG